MNVNRVTMADHEFIWQLDLKLLSFVDGILTLPCVRACVLSHFCPVWLFAAIWTVSCQAPLPMWFSRQEHWSGVPCPPPENLPDPGIEPASLIFPALAGQFFTMSTPGEALWHFYMKPKMKLFLESKIGESNCGCDQSENKRKNLTVFSSLGQLHW